MVKGEGRMGRVRRVQNAMQMMCSPVQSSPVQSTLHLPIPPMLYSKSSVCAVSNLVVLASFRPKNLNQAHT